MTHYDYKGREINEEWFKRVAEKFKEDYKAHYLPQKLKAKGYSQRNGKWEASIKIFGNTKNLGTFDTQQEARKAFEEAIKEFIDNFDEYWQQYYLD